MSRLTLARDSSLLRLGYSSKNDLWQVAPPPLELTCPVIPPPPPPQPFSTLLSLSNSSPPSRNLNPSRRSRDTF